MRDYTAEKQTYNIANNVHTHVTSFSETGAFVSY